MNLDTNRKLIAAALAAAGRGDRNALQTVYRLTAAKLFAVCLRILGERSEAEDVLQEVYMTVWRKAAIFDPALSSPMTWLIAIARNRAIDQLRMRGRSRHMDPIEEAAELADDKPTAEATLQSARRSRRGWNVASMDLPTMNEQHCAVRFLTATLTKSLPRA